MTDPLLFPRFGAVPPYAQRRTSNHHDRKYALQWNTGISKSYKYPAWGVAGTTRGRVVSPFGPDRFVSTTDHADGHVQTQIIGVFGTSTKCNFRENWLRGDYGGGGDEASWPVTKFNRMRYFVKVVNLEPYDTDTLETIYPQLNGRGDRTLDTGTYIKCPDFGDTEYPNTADEENTEQVTNITGKSSGHFYHENHWCEGEDVWQIVMLDQQPAYQRDTNDSSGHIHIQNEPFPTKWGGRFAGYTYFDVLRRYYTTYRGNVRPKVGNFGQQHMSEGQFFEEPYTYCTLELEHRVANLSGAWVEERNSISVSFNTIYSPAGYPELVETCSVEMRTSFTTTYTPTGWDDATPQRTVQTGPNRGDRSQIYQITPFDWEGNDVVYVAFRIVQHDREPNPEAWGWRELPLCKDSTQLPPFPGE